MKGEVRDDLQNTNIDWLPLQLETELRKVVSKNSLEVESNSELYNFMKGEVRDDLQNANINWLPLQLETELQKVVSKNSLEVESNSELYNFWILFFRDF